MYKTELSMLLIALGNSNITGVFEEKFEFADGSDLASATIGKAASKIIDESIKKQEEQDKD